jgi:hypothetical protein
MLSCVLDSISDGWEGGGGWISNYENAGLYTCSLVKSKCCLLGRAPFPVILAIEDGKRKIKYECRLFGGYYLKLALVLLRTVIYSLGVILNVI